MGVTCSCGWTLFMTAPKRELRHRWRRHAAKAAAKRRASIARKVVAICRGRAA